MKKEHLGIKIKRIRAFKGMKREDLAAAIGKTRSLISYFERTGNINKYTLMEIANALAIDAETLEINDGEVPTFTMEDKNQNKLQKINCEETIQRQKEEILFLKDTINQQWKLLQKLSNKK
jgi:transcriptional regulator with XRE-family HTH domain